MKVVYCGFDSSWRRDYRVTCGPDDLPPIPLGKLIAAAPDLLEAAKKALAEMSLTSAPRNSFTDAVDALDEAIAKATQEAPNAPSS
jgi:hypothetical protein